jgi:phosphate transport system substrate-binding protein
LLDRGAQINAADREGRVPLHVAAKENHEAVVMTLLDRGAQIQPVDREGRTPLHVAAEWGATAVARLLLDRGAQVNVADKEGMTPLHAAAGENHESLVRLLLDRGAQVNAADRESVTPLHAAARENHEGVARLLLDRGAQVNAADKEGTTPLHLAARVTRRLFEAPKGQAGVAGLLLDRGARVEARTMKGATPLQVAGEEGNEEVARVLLGHGARADTATKGLMTPLHAAVKKGHADVVRLLLKGGASITATDSYGRSPLHVAAGDGRGEMVRLLLGAGAPVTVEDKEGRTPVHEPAGRGYEGVVQLLLEHGAKATMPDRKGWTPLHMAAFHGHEGIVRLLLDRGAPVSPTDVQGVTPLQGAAFYGYTGVVRLLQDRGASKEVGDPRGTSVPLVKADGSSTLFPVTEAVADEFHSATRGAVRVTVGISGSGGGFQKFCRGETDVQDASRPILTAEIALCRAKGIKYFELPVAYDALSVVVSTNNTWVEAVTVQELKAIWEPAAEGNVTLWSHVRREWPPAPLKLFGPGADSGSFDYFTEAIVGRARASRRDYTASEDDNFLVDGIAESRFALGYVPFAYLEPNRIRLKALAIDAGGQPVLPSRATVTTGQYRPLARPLFLYVSQRAAERPAVKQFVEFYLSRAARLVEEVKYVPFRAEAYASVLQNFRQGKVGTVFSGTATVGARVEDLVARAAHP